MKLSISLKKKPENPLQPSISKAKPPPSLFSQADDADDDEQLAAAAAPKPGASYNVEASKAMRKKMEAEKKVDATVYEYDEVWDRMQMVKQKQKEAKEIESLERKVCEFAFLALGSGGLCAALLTF